MCLPAAVVLLLAQTVAESPAQLLADAEAHLRAGQFREARSTAMRLLNVDRYHPAALKLKGNAEYFLGEYDQSMSTFVTLLDHHPNDEEGAYMLGRIYYQEGRIDQAIGQLERSLRLNPKSYRAWDNLGLCWEALGDNDKAISHFLKSIRVAETEAPDYDWAYANLADLLLKMGDADRAFAAASKAAKRNPNSARNFYVGAKALYKLDKTDLCLNWLERAASLDPNYSEVQFLLARVYREISRPEDAERAKKRFLELKAREPSKRR